MLHLKKMTNNVKIYFLERTPIESLTLTESSRAVVADGKFEIVNVFGNDLDDTLEKED